MAKSKAGVVAAIVLVVATVGGAVFWWWRRRVVVKADASPIFDAPDGNLSNGQQDPIRIAAGSVLQRAGDDVSGYTPVRVPDGVAWTPGPSNDTVQGAPDPARTYYIPTRDI